MKISVVMIDGSFRENLFGAEYFCKQDFDENEYEVIWVEFYKKANPGLSAYPTLKVIELGNENSTEYHSSHCFNKGIEYATGEVIIIPDADQIVRPNFIQNIWDKHQKYDKLVSYIYRYDEIKKGELQSLNFDELEKKCILKNPLNYGGCLTVRKKWLNEINGYEMHPIFKSGFHANGSDMYTRFKNLGLAIEWENDVKLYHPWHPSTLTPAPQYENQLALIKWRAKKVETLALNGIDSSRDRINTISVEDKNMVEKELEKVLKHTSQNKIENRKITDLKKKLNLFIVGAAKAGTTSLWYALKENKNVFLPVNSIDKEPAFFSPMKKSRSESKVVDIFDDVDNEKYVGECSTAYITDQKSARLIHQYNADAKIIIILRNPAKRAYSLYNWMVQHGYEYANTFTKALKLEKIRREKVIPNTWEPEYYHNYQYFRSGLYHDKVKRYYDLFGKENVYVMSFEDFKNSQTTEYKKLCLFLDIEENDYEKEPKNPSYYVINSYFQFFLRKVVSFMLRNKISLVGTKSLQNRDWLLRIGILKSRKPKKMDEKLYNELIERYRNDIENLTKLTGVNFNTWLSEGL